MRLTSREKEIMELLRKDPLIAQDELADSLGVARSSIAVHISNLMKKGAILGKGYVFNEQITVVVIGTMGLTVNIAGDEKQLIDLKWGGSAFEISRILAHFNLHVRIISVLGDDDIAQKILTGLKADGIDISIIEYKEKTRSDRQVTVNGQIKYAEVFPPQVTEHLVDTQEWLIFNSEWLVVEPQFIPIIYNKSLAKDEEKIPRCCTYQYITDEVDYGEYWSRFSVLVLGLPGTEQMEYYTDKIQNNIETDQLWVLTDGKNRLLFWDQGSPHEFPMLPNQQFPCEQSLNALLSGIVYGLANGHSPRQAVRMGLGATSLRLPANV